MDHDSAPPLRPSPWRPKRKQKGKKRKHDDERKKKTEIWEREKKKT